jgi:hypothetical protein
MVAKLRIIFETTKKVEKKMLRNIRNIRYIFSLRGVINSDTPKRVSRFATPFTSAVACHHCFPIPASAEWQYG